MSAVRNTCTSLDRIFRWSLPRLGVAAILLSCAGTLWAQDRFPSRIPFGDVRVELVSFATVPDSSPGSPPRISLLTKDPAGRMFVSDQRGVMHHIAADGSSVVEYLDLRDYAATQVLSTSEAGFQAFAFHPDFNAPGTDGYGLLYTVFSSSNTGARSPDFDPGGSTSFHTVLLEWRTNDPSAVPFLAANPSEPFREVLRLKQPFGNHNAGLIAFNPLAAPEDPDHGNLYMSVGDGGSGGDPQENAEDPSNPYGAILRIDPLGGDAANGRYGIVGANELASDEDPQTLGEIYAYGFRNPQRFGWDADTGAIYVADIGQNSVEEISVLVNGGHFGWDAREGSFSYEGGSGTYIDPVAEYDHTNPVADPPTSIGNRAVTCGEVVRGTGINDLDGLLFLADFPTGSIFTLDVDTSALAGGQDDLRLLRLEDADGSPVTFIGLINQARAGRGLGTTSRTDLRFGFNTPGEVYITNKHDGIVRRLRLVPFGSISQDAGSVTIQYSGRLHESESLEPDSWMPLDPQPESPWTYSPSDTRRFFRVESN